MARVAMTGFEVGVLTGEPFGASVSGGVLDTGTVRTGARSYKITETVSLFSYSAAFAQPSYCRFYLNFSAASSTSRSFFGAFGGPTLVLNAANKIELYSSVPALLGTSTIVLTTGRWYCIEVSLVAGAASLRVDGVVEIAAVASGSTSLNVAVGCDGSGAGTYTAFCDDLAVDNAEFPGPGGVVLLVPTADSAVGTGWTLGTGTAVASDAFGSVDNEPPVGVADLAAGSDPKQLRNAASAANSNYDATMTTYAAAGVTGVINAEVPFVWTGAPVVTSAKAGTVGVASNPAITNIALAAGGTSGAFWSGATAAAFPTGWKVSPGTMTSRPAAIAFGTAPVMRVTQVTSSTRIAMLCFMGIYVDFTPPPVRPVRVRQAVQRAASY